MAFDGRAGVVARGCASPRVAAVSPKLVLLGLCLLALAGPRVAAGQARAAKLPGPERIVGDYLKAVGGKKKLASIRDAAYEWRAEGASGGGGSLRVAHKWPASSRSDILLASGEVNVAANARTAWTRTLAGTLQTLTGREADAAKLQAALDATRLVDFKKQDVLARTVSLEQIGGESAYLVEFSRRNGARLRYWFSAASKLLLVTRDDERGVTTRFSDYRAEAGGPAEPRRLEIKTDDGEAFTLALQSARYNTGLADTLFEPPGDASLNVVELWREVARNQRELDERVSSYTFTRTQVEREINDRGEVKKEKTQVHEVYPVAGGGRVLKLVAEDGQPLPPEKLAREERRVVEEIEKLERENERRKQKREVAAAKREAEAAKRKGETGAGEDGDDDVGIGVFLRACEFFSPRRERFRDRDVIVFDFRPRPGFKPANRGESIAGKLAGVVWIDPADRQVMRLEARLTEGFKIGGGLLASVRPGSAFAFEQTRLPDGVWLPKFSQINAAAKLFLFAGLRIDATREYSNYKRFDSKTGDATIDSPKKPEPQN